MPIGARWHKLAHALATTHYFLQEYNSGLVLEFSNVLTNNCIQISNQKCPTVDLQMDNNRINPKNVFDLCLIR